LTGVRDSTVGASAIERADVAGRGPHCAAGADWEWCADDSWEALLVDG